MNTLSIISIKPSKTSIRRETTLEQGLCRQCMKRPAKEGLKHCQRCLNWFQMRRVLRKHRGCCPACGRETDELRKHLGYECCGQCIEVKDNQSRGFGRRTDDQLRGAWF